jgi:hypothetical protein
VRSRRAQKGTAKLCVQLGSNRTLLNEFTNHRTITFRFAKEMKYGILINNKSAFVFAEAFKTKMCQNSIILPI